MMRRTQTFSLLLMAACAMARADSAPTWLELGQQAADRWRAAQPFACDYTLDALQTGIFFSMRGNLLAVPDGNDGKFSMHGTINAADHSEYPVQLLYTDAFLYILELREEGAQGRQSLPEPALFLPPAGPALFRLLDAAWNFTPLADHQHEQAMRCYRGAPREGVTLAIPFTQLEVCLDAETLHARRVAWREGPAEMRITVEYGPAKPAADFDASRLIFEPPPGAHMHWLSQGESAPTGSAPAPETPASSDERHAESAPEQP